jgi:hypothetical protein
MKMKQTNYFPPVRKKQSGSNATEFKWLIVVILLIMFFPILIGFLFPAWKQAIGVGAGIGAGLAVLLWLLAMWPGVEP